MGKQTKIVVVGPLYPYKGGIAQYNAMLVRALRGVPGVTVVPLSFEVQYPGWLFRAPQKDYESDAFKIEDATFPIHTANPFNWGKVANIINGHSPDLVIFEWWHPYFIPCYNGIIKRLKNARILFLCHNVLPHEKIPFAKRMAKGLLAKGDCFIVHSKQDADDLRSMLPQARYVQARIPSFWQTLPTDEWTRKTAQQALGIDGGKQVLLYFGFIRKYKGLRYLLQAMPRIVQRYPDTLLLIVGEFREDKQEYLALIEELGIAPYIQLHDGYIPDKEVGKYFVACDLVVLPYASATQTGIAPIAFGFGRAVVATDTGGLPEVVKDGRVGYIVPPCEPKALADAVVRFFEEDKAAEFEKNAGEEMYHYQWDRLADAVRELGGF